MLQAARHIEAFLAGKAIADLVVDKLLHSGMERRFEMLGEVSAHVSAEAQALWTGVNRQVTKGLRNLIAHDYFRVDSAKRRQISQAVIPDLPLVLEGLFTDLGRQFGPDAGV